MYGLKRIYHLLGEFPIVGPDGSYEADLLLAGAKPIGLFVDVRVPPDIVQEITAPLRKIREDIQRLEKAATEDRLRKHSFSIREERGSIQTWNFYSQPHRQKDMLQLSRQMHADCLGIDAEDPINLDYGFYFGYKNSDITLFANGGYESLPSPLKQIFKASHNFRLQCRLASRLNVDIREIDLQL